MLSSGLAGVTLLHTAELRCAVAWDEAFRYLLTSTLPVDALEELPRLSFGKIMALSLFLALALVWLDDTLCAWRFLPSCAADTGFRSRLRALDFERCDGSEDGWASTASVPQTHTYSHCKKSTAVLTALLTTVAIICMHTLCLQQFYESLQSSCTQDNDRIKKCSH